MSQDNTTWSNSWMINISTSLILFEYRITGSLGQIARKLSVAWNPLLLEKLHWNWNTFHHSFIPQSDETGVGSGECSMVWYEQLVLLLPTTFIHFHNCIATTSNKRYLFCMEGKPSTSSSQFTFRRRAKTTSGGATLPSNDVAKCRLLEKTARRTYFSKWNPLISNPYIPWLSNCNWIELPNSNFRHTFVQYFRTGMQSVL